MVPSTLALVEDDVEFAEQIARHLREYGIQVSVFDDSDALLTDRAPYDFGFYVIDLALPGIDGVDLIRVLRRRTEAGILAVSARLAPEAFDAAMQVGADMYLAKPIRGDQLLLAIKAVQRRAVAALQCSSVWRIDRRAGQLIAPDGARVDLSATDLAVMECFLEAQGRTVEREQLRQRLGLSPNSDSDNALHATIYRLRRRIERATPALVPLQTRSRRGYVFRAQIVAA
ncbi:MAG: response regulator transcription factor [Burkholderiales bacterium]|nr:response regulator transcription factor [Burkholderiales bacterium]OJX04514.1 MAG: transcriptional regulator [Burkholderiales bacterium 70-64]